MARAKRRATPVFQPSKPAIPKGRRTPVPPIPVRHTIVIRDGSGRRVKADDFDTAQDANRAARSLAQDGRGTRVAQVRVRPAVPVPAVRVPESERQRSVRLNRVSLGDAAMSALLAEQSRPVLSDAERAKFSALRARLAAVRAANAAAGSPAVG